MSDHTVKFSLWRRCELKRYVMSVSGVPMIVASVSLTRLEEAIQRLINDSLGNWNAFGGGSSYGVGNALESLPSGAAQDFPTITTEGQPVGIKLDTQA